VFFGSGGYATALAARDWHFKGGWDVFALLPFAGLFAAAIAVPIGLVALRTRRHTFVVVTIAIFFIFQLGAFNLGFTGSTSGLQLPFAPFSPDTYTQPFYYVGCAILALTVLSSWLVRRSRFGLQLLAIRDDEDRARGLGVKTGRVKLSAFVLSAFPVGMSAGCSSTSSGRCSRRRRSIPCSTSPWRSWASSEAWPRLRARCSVRLCSRFSSST
jgi:branched-chain amino acid transport system permease protein